MPITERNGVVCVVLYFAHKTIENSFWGYGTHELRLEKAYLRLGEKKRMYCCCPDNLNCLLSTKRGIVCVCVVKLNVRCIFNPY